MAWFYVILASLFEMLAVMLIARYHQKRTLLALGQLIGTFALSFIFLTLAMKVLPMSTTYAVWTGVGTAGGALLGIIFYQESANFKRIIGIGLIITATVGLKLLT